MTAVDGSQIGMRLANDQMTMSLVRTPNFDSFDCGGANLVSAAETGFLKGTWPYT